MSLTNRRARPLKRDEGTLRDDRLFIVACDDTYAPRLYFDLFQIPRVQVHVVPAEPGQNSAAHVLKGLLEIDHEEDDELWMLLDTDHYTSGSHLKGFMQAITEARQMGVHIAVSKPCFELWLLLHHAESAEVSGLATASAVEQKLRATQGGYSKTNLKKEHYPLETVREACLRAARIDENVGGGDNPNANTTRVYLLWESIVDKALPSQLPSALAELVELWK